MKNPHTLYELPNGRQYAVRLESSDCYYGMKKVFSIKDMQPELNLSFRELRDDVSFMMNELLGRNVLLKVDKENLYKKSPTMSNAMLPYYEFTYDENIDMHIYTYTEPYDD